MDDRIRQIISRYKNKVSTDEDTSLNLTLDNTTRVIKPNANPINTVIDVGEQFDIEREFSNSYRILGRLNIITANELTQGSEPYENVNEVIVVDYRGTETLDWDPLFTEFTNNTGTIVRTPNNWLIQICYPSDMLPNYNIWGDNSVNKPVNLGMRVIDLSSNTPSGNRSLLVVETTQTHKLSEGDYIHLNDRENLNQYQGIHKVYEVGQNGDDLTTKITLETSWKGSSDFQGGDTNEMFLNRVVNSSDNDVWYNNDNIIASFTNTDITGGTTNTNYVLVTTPNEHGLGENGYIEIRNINGGIMNGFHRAHAIIDANNFTIQPPNVDFTVVGYTYRRMDGTPSDYYVRQFELLTGNNYDTYLAAFSTSIYPETSVPEFGVANKTWLFNLTKDVNTGSLISHRGGIVNELKMCFLKRSGKAPYNWSNVTSNWDFNSTLANTTTTVDLGNGTTGIEIVSVNNPGGAGTIVKNTPKTVNGTGSKYIGDIIEYNRKEVKEKTITEVIFRFGLEGGDGTPITNNNIPTNPNLINGVETYTDGAIDGIPLKNLEGYYYNPFKALDIKKFSNFIEKANPEDVIDGIPADYELYPDGSKAWRDLLTNGFIEEGTNGVNWPFLNGSHYVYMNNYLYIRRQNPYTVIDQSEITTVNPKDNC
jgi:hypothetical protein